MNTMAELGRQTAKQSCIDLLSALCLPLSSCNRIYNMKQVLALTMQTYPTLTPYP